jgi:hypothetical protein
MVEDVFNPAKNPSFKTGEAIRWIVTNDAGKAVGRIGAFYNSKKTHTFEQPTGGCGFFECTDNQERPPASKKSSISISTRATFDRSSPR